MSPNAARLPPELRCLAAERGGTGVLIRQFVQAIPGIGVDSLYSGDPRDHEPSPPEWTAERQAVIERLHAQGRRAVYHISVGSWEDWHPDAGVFPEVVLGRDHKGWPGERWLDIRRIDLLAPILRARFDRCAEKGFDAIEPDNIDIHGNPTGCPLTYADQLAYARWLADEAHARGLAIGLKNAPDMVADAVDIFDFAVTEDAFHHGWMEETLPFIEHGKAVFAAEYMDISVDFAAACAGAAPTTSGSS